MNELSRKNDNPNEDYSIIGFDKLTKSDVVTENIESRRKSNDGKSPFGMTPP